MRRTRLPFQVIWPLGLLVLVGALAWLQYRWLGQVSEAERDRMQATLKQRADEFAEDFDREIMSAYSAFQTDGGALLAGDATAFAQKYDAWRATAKEPELVLDVFLVDTAKPQVIRQYDATTRAFVPAEWPADLKIAQDQFVHHVDRPGPLGGQVVSFTRAPILASVPALVVTLPAISTSTSTSATFTLNAFTSMRVNTAALIIRLNPGYVRSGLPALLAARYFTAHGIDSYRIAVIDPQDPAAPLFSRGLPSSDATLDPAHADASVGLFAIRPELNDAGPGPRTMVFTAGSTSRGGGSPPAVKTDSLPARISSGSALSVFIEQRSTTAAVTSDVMRANVKQVSDPAWRLVLQHSSGSLEAAVTSARRRNLSLSFGILALLATSVGLILVTAQRAQRLAAQQMDFVATVSHELRTPLAVIRSAAQNLSAGVIHDAAHTKRYGELIDDEGRRLTGMVEQVLEFAGLEGNRRRLATRPVDLVALVKDVVASCAETFAASHVDIEVAGDPQTPLAAADEHALRRALNNLLTNAMKYGADGGWVGVSVKPAAFRGRPEVEVTVRDRGRGIDPADLPHVFEPFYRGRYAIDRQIHGNGLGLSLVKRIAEAHGGRVTVTSTPGDGAAFTLRLPAATPEPAIDPLGSGAPHRGSVA